MSDGTQVDFGLQNYTSLLFDGEKSKNAMDWFKSISAKENPIPALSKYLHFWHLKGLNRLKASFQVSEEAPRTSKWAQASDFFGCKVLNIWHLAEFRDASEMGEHHSTYTI